MQLAFGSKVMKPVSAKTGVSAAAGEVRGRAHGAAAADVGTTLSRPRR